MITVASEVAGVVQEVIRALGAEVEQGDTLLILESMKMEIPIEAPVAGRIADLAVAVGEPVSVGDVLLRIAQPAG